MVYLKSALAGLLAVGIAFSLLVLGAWLVFSFPHVFLAPFVRGNGVGSFSIGFPLLWIVVIAAVAFAIGFWWQFRRV